MGDTERVLTVFLMYSVAMFTVPLLTFFGVQEILKREFHIEGFTNTVWSVIAAVAVVNLIIVLYAVKAYHDEKKEEKPKIQDDNIPSSTSEKGTHDSTMKDHKKES